MIIDSISRKIAGVRVTPDVIANTIMAEGTQFELCNRGDLPPNAKLHSVAYDSCCAEFVVYFTHEDFRDVLLGDEVPILRGPEYRILKEQVPA